MIVTNKLNTGTTVKPDYKSETIATSEAVVAEAREESKEAELILSDSARQKSNAYAEGVYDTAIVEEVSQYTPQDALEMIRTANERILDHASEAVLAQANQDAREVTELLSA